MRPDAMSTKKTSHSSSGRILVLASTGAVGGFLLWSSWADIDQITRAPAAVIVSARDQVIQAPEGGIVKEIMAKEGSHVKKGQVLLSFERAKAESAYLESRAKVAALKASIARLWAEVSGGTPKFPPEVDAYPDIRRNEALLFRQRQTAVNAEIAALRQSLGLVKSELDINMPLLASGDVSRVDVLKIQRQEAEIEGQISNRRNKYLQESQADLSRASEDLAGVEQILAERRDQLERTVITSPMDGIVRNVRITTLGGVARVGDEIMQIVPSDDDMMIQAKVKPADIAFVKPGLPATVKLDAYDYTIYGSLPGKVTYISPDTISDENRGPNDQPYYRVEVKVDAQQKKRNIDIQPGMTATVEIRTGSNTVLKYLTKPITKTLSESLGER